MSFDVKAAGQWLKDHPPAVAGAAGVAGLALYMRHKSTAGSSGGNTPTPVDPGTNTAGLSGYPNTLATDIENEVQDQLNSFQSSVNGQIAAIPAGPQGPTGKTGNTGPPGSGNLIGQWYETGKYGSQRGHTVDVALLQKQGLIKKSGKGYVFTGKNGTPKGHPFSYTYAQGIGFLGLRPVVAPAPKAK